MWGVFVPSDVIIIMLLLISVFFVFNLLIEILLSESCTLSSIYIFYYFWLNSIFEENSWQSHTPDWLRIHLVIISDIKFANTVHNLGVCLDPTLSFQQQISSVCRICYLELRRISAIRHYLSEDVTKKLLCAFVLSRLGYCNSLLAGCPKYLLSKLQKVQNNAARLIFRPTRSAHVTPMLHSLHWLPIEQRIEYKESLL